MKILSILKQKRKSHVCGYGLLVGPTRAPYLFAFSDTPTPLVGLVVAFVALSLSLCSCSSYRNISAKTDRNASADILITDSATQTIKNSVTFANSADLLTRIFALQSLEKNEDIEFHFEDGILQHAQIKRHSRANSSVLRNEKAKIQMDFAILDSIFTENSTNNSTLLQEDESAVVEEIKKNEVKNTPKQILFITLVLIWLFFVVRYNIKNRIHR